MADVGRNTILDKELFRKIKESILAGNDLRTTAKVCEINELTLYSWTSDNYLNISDKIEGWKRDRLIMLAEDNVKAILALGISDKDSLKVVQDTSKFVLETLNKEQYSKKQETDITSNGESINKVLVEFVKDEFKNDTSPDRISTTL